MNELTAKYHELVKLILSIYPEGEDFFTNMDLATCNFLNKSEGDEIIEKFFHGISRWTTIVSSGKFGEKLKKVCHNSKEGKFASMRFVIARGELREFDLSAPEKKALRDLHLTDWVYVDDSYYQGKAYSKIAHAIGCEPKEIRVFYDGSYVPARDLTSWFRYHPVIER